MGENGLLDFIKTPEGQGLLSAAFAGLAGARRGQPLNSLGRAGLAGLQGYSGAIEAQEKQAENAFQKQYRTLQMSKLEQDMASDKARQTFLTGLTQAPQTALSQGAALGDIGPTKTNATRLEASMPPGLGRIPRDALQAEIALNGGKSLPEWMFKTGTPDMQVANGVAYDKNALLPGFMPQLSISNDGKGTMITIDPATKLPVVSAPRGAVETFGAYRGVEESTRAGYDTMPITLPDGSTVLTTRGAVVDGVQPRSPAPTPRAGTNAIGTGYAGGSAAAAASGQREIMLSERAKAVVAGRADDVAAIDRELARLPGGGSQSPVPGIPVQSEAQKLQATKQIEGQAVSEAARQKDRVTARKFLNQAKVAEDLLMQNPTGSLAGSMRDTFLGAFGKTTEAANASQKLKAVSGWLVSNTPRMEGPQSNFDVENYKVMAADVGNDQLPVERRLAALRTVMGMFSEVIGEEKPQANESKPVVNGKVFDSKPPAQLYKGKTMTGPDGKRYQSDGMIWKEVR